MVSLILKASLPNFKHLVCLPCLSVGLHGVSNPLAHFAFPKPLAMNGGTRELANEWRTGHHGQTVSRGQLTPKASVASLVYRAEERKLLKVHSLRLSDRKAMLAPMVSRLTAVGLGAHSLKVEGEASSF